MQPLAKSFEAAICDTDRAEALRIVQLALSQGVTAETLLFDLVLPTVRKTMRSVSENREVSLAQHFMTSQIAAELAAWRTPRLRKKPEPGGRLVIGTSQGDFHGLGKTIVTGCLQAYGFEVIDLGLNVAPQVFVDRAISESASVIGISSMMVHTALGESGSRKVRGILRERGLERRIKILVGGAPYRHDPQLFRMVQADAWAEDGLRAVSVLQDLLREVKP